MHETPYRMAWPAKPQPSECASFYRPYVAVAAAGGDSLDTVLEEDVAKWKRLLASVAPGKEGHRYAPGKWTIREVVGHVTDAETHVRLPRLGVRPQRRRALSAVRREQLRDELRRRPPAPWRPWAPSSERYGRRRPCSSKGSRPAFGGRTGVASSCEFTVRALAWIMAGHSVHHRKVLVERYL